MLHDVPPPGSTRSNANLRARNRGYRALDEEDANINQEDVDTPSVPVYDSVEDESVKPDEPRRQSWAALITSFSVSGFMTVSVMKTFCTSLILRRTATGLLFPSSVFDTSFRKILGRRVALVIYTQSIIRWTRWPIHFIEMPGIWH